MNEHEAHLRSLAEKAKKPNFVMAIWGTAAWARDEIDRLRGIIKEADEYLDTNRLTNIAHGSILHQKFKEVDHAPK